MEQSHFDSFKGRGSLILAATVALIAVQTKKTDGNVLDQTAGHSADATAPDPTESWWPGTDEKGLRPLFI